MTVFVRRTTLFTVYQVLTTTPDDEYSRQSTERKVIQCWFVCMHGLELATVALEKIKRFTIIQFHNFEIFQHNLNFNTKSFYVLFNRKMSEPLL